MSPSKPEPDRHIIRTETTINATRDAPCPACGQLLWFSLEEETPQRVLSTAEAARICKVSQQIIVRCFDAGEIQGYFAPGARLRRIPYQSLVRFMIQHGIPVPD